MNLPVKLHPCAGDIAHRGGSGIAPLLAVVGPDGVGMHSTFILRTVRSMGVRSGSFLSFCRENQVVFGPVYSLPVHKLSLRISTKASLERAVVLQGAASCAGSNGTKGLFTCRCIHVRFLGAIRRLCATPLECLHYASANVLAI